MTDITEKFKSSPICTVCGKDVRVYSNGMSIMSECACGHEVNIVIAETDDLQDDLYKNFGANFIFGRSSEPLSAKSSKIKIFLSGPMSGYKGYNFSRFDSIAEKLERSGIEVVNPVTICRKFKQETVIKDKGAFARMVAEQQEAEKTCTAILLLNGWEVSNGAKLELMTALKNGLDIFKESDIDLLTSYAKSSSAKMAIPVEEIADNDWKT